MEVLVDAGFDVNPFCGGRGVCGKCRVRIKDNPPAPSPSEKSIFQEEELAEGFRLACQVELDDDLEVILEEGSEITGLSTGISTTTELQPGFKKGRVHLEKPVLEDPRDFVQRIHDELGTSDITLDALRELDMINKKEPFTILSREGKITGIEAGDTTRSLFGLAIDIGTTVIAIYLMDLGTGEEVDVQTVYNPQRRYGADVISRVNHTIQNKDGVTELQEVLLQGINEGIEELCSRQELKTDSIVQAVIVGNTIMLHTLLGVNADSIARIPYIPLFTDPLNFQPGELGIKINNCGLVQLLPSISGYIGADLIGDMLAVDFNSFSGASNMLIDIGTNGEIVLGNKEGIVACSTAAGPAFEGASITSGMAGTSGAVSEFSLKQGEAPQIKTIGDKPARGICGSGLLDIVAELNRLNFIKTTGTFCSLEEMTDWQKSFMTEANGITAFRVVEAEKSDNGREIVVSQKDIREVQLAKGAVAAGINLLLKEVELNCDDIGIVFLAGGFGNYLNPTSAARIKMIPPELEGKIQRIGNAAGTGARMALLNKGLEAQTRELKDLTRYFELSVKTEFQEKFVEAMEF